MLLAHHSLKDLNYLNIGLIKICIYIFVRCRIKHKHVSGRFSKRSTYQNTNEALNWHTLSYTHTPCRSGICWTRSAMTNSHLLPSGGALVLQLVRSSVCVHVSVCLCVQCAKMSVWSSTLCAKLVLECLQLCELLA